MCTRNQLCLKRLKFIEHKGYDNWYVLSLERITAFLTIWNKTHLKLLLSGENQMGFVPMYKQIVHAIQIQLTSLLEGSEQRNKFYKKREIKSEDKTLEIFKSLFKDSAKYYTSVFENDKSQNEHDLVIEYGETIFIVEVKASKVRNLLDTLTKLIIELREILRVMVVSKRAMTKA